jgi:DNA repair exonuclease SbcCD ATPase subunit
MEEGCKELQLSHEQRISLVEASARSAHHRIDEVQKNQEILIEMNKNIGIIAEKNSELNKKLDKVEEDVEELKEKPGKHWEQLTSNIITVLVSGFMGAMINAYLK